MSVEEGGVGRELTSEKFYNKLNAGINPRVVNVTEFISVLGFQRS